MVKKIDEIKEKTGQCDEAQDKGYSDKAGHELPEELKTEEKRLGKIRTAEEALKKLGDKRSGD